tara:strand:- start:30695 stop:31126 length:432 start_codon:yes stop_codon:yes gene_type:complete
MSFSNYRYNRIGGIDVDKALESGDTVPYTLSEDEIKDIQLGTSIADYVATNTAVEDFKRERQSMLDNAVVTISTGKSFDADELSINRMVNAILAAIDEQDTFIIKWSTADTGTGELVDCTLLELKEAHKLAMQNMASIWSIEG